MLQLLSRIGLIIGQFHFPRITGDQPDAQEVVAAGEIIMRIFQPVIESFQTIMLVGPGREIPVNRPYVGQRENVPAFLYVYAEINGITPEFFERHGSFVKETGIDEPFVDFGEGPGNGAEGKGISRLKRKLSFDNISAGNTVSVDIYIPDLEEVFLFRYGWNAVCRMSLRFSTRKNTGSAYGKESKQCKNECKIFIRFSDH
jgi:hypothetical protein